MHPAATSAVRVSTNICILPDKTLNLSCADALILVNYSTFPYWQL